MIIHDCEQGSAEWFAARCGIPTASSFDKLITPTGKPSTQADAYLHQLLAEWVMGEKISLDSTYWMQRGTELEPEAREWYGFVAGEDVRQVGFITTDGGMAGCSPDGLIGDKGGVEIKCPAPGTHIEYLLSGKLPGKYRAQVQGCMYITGADWWDFVSYHPSIKPLCIRAERDDDYISALHDIVSGFAARLIKKREQLIDQGIKEAA